MLKILKGTGKWWLHLNYIVVLVAGLVTNLLICKSNLTIEVFLRDYLIQLAICSYLAVILVELFRRQIRIEAKIGYILSAPLVTVIIFSLFLLESRSNSGCNRHQILITCALSQVLVFIVSIFYLIISKYVVRLKD
jgi:hypothetical protein